MLPIPYHRLFRANNRLFAIPLSIQKYSVIAHRACNKTILPKYAIRVAYRCQICVYSAVYLQTQMENNARHDQSTAFLIR